MGMSTPRYPPVVTTFSEGDKVTLANGRQGRIYQDGFGNTAYLLNDKKVYVYFFPKGKRDLDLVEEVLLTDIMPHIGWN